MAFAAFVNLTIALEISQGVARFYASEPDRTRQIEYVSSAFWFTSACYSVFAVVALSFAPAISGLIMGKNGEEATFSIGVAYIWANGLFYLIQNQFRWELRSSHYALVSIVMSVVSASASIFLIWFLDFGLKGLIAGLFIGSAMASVLGLYWLRASIRFAFNTLLLRQMLRFSAPLVLSGVTVWFGLYADRLMIQRMLSVEHVGLYGIGFRYASMAGLVILGFQAALTPLVYTYVNQKETPAHLAQIFRIFILFFLLISLCLTIYALDILRIMTTPDFYSSADVVVYLVPAILLASMYIFSPGIAIAKKTHLVVWINVIGGAVNIALNYLLIPIFGITGAASATFIGFLLVFTLYLVFGQRFYHIPHSWWSIAVPVIITATLLVIFKSVIWTDAMRWSFGVVAVVTVTGVGIFSGLIRTDEIRRVSNFLRFR